LTHVVLPLAERTVGKGAACWVLRAGVSLSTQHAARRTPSPTPWSRSVDSGSKRYVVLGSLLSIADLLHELVEMLGCVNEIDLVGIHNQQRRLVVPVKVVRVRLTELLQIRGRDCLFVGTPALFDALE